MKNKTIREITLFSPEKMDGFIGLIKEYIDQPCVISYCKNVFGSAAILKTKLKYKGVIINYYYYDNKIAGGRFSITKDILTVYKHIKSDNEAVLLPPEIESKIIAQLI